MRGLTAALVLLSAAGLCQAGTLSPVYSPGDLGANASVDWSIFFSAFGKLPTNFIADPFDVVTTSGLPVTVDGETVGNSQGLVLEWQGEFGMNFNAGDYLLYSTAQVPITLTFDTPVLGAGLAVNVFPGPTPPTPFTAILDVYNGSTLLGSELFSTTTSGGPGGMAPYVGVLDSSQEITKIVISVQQGGQGTYFAIDGLDLVVATPEPSSLALLGIGCAAVFGRKALRRRG